jgi:phosphate transport system substrate-binding protein
MSNSKQDLTTAGWLGRLLIWGVLVTAVWLTVGCQTQEYGLREPLKIAGSTTLEPALEELALMYMEQHPDVDVTVRGGGSTIGIEGVVNNALHIGMSSRGLRDEEKSAWPGLQAIPVAYDGLAVVINRQVRNGGVSELTLEQIEQIWRGEIVNWQEVGGPDLPIVVYERAPESGTQVVFEELVLGGPLTERDHLGGSVSSSEDVIRAVTEEPGGVSALSFGLLTLEVVGVPIRDGEQLLVPNEENVLSGVYPLRRELYLLTNGAPEGTVAEFLALVLSPEGQQKITREGFIGVTP